MPSYYHRKMDETDKTKKSKTPSKGNLKHIRIEKAENGYMVSHAMEEKPGAPYTEPHQSVFPDSDGVIDHVRSLMTGKD